MVENTSGESTAQLFERARQGTAEAWLKLPVAWSRKLASGLHKDFEKLTDLEAKDVVEEVLEDICLHISRFLTWKHAWKYARMTCRFRGLQILKKNPRQSSTSTIPEMEDPRGKAAFRDVDLCDEVEASLEKYPQPKRATLKAILIGGRKRSEASKTFGTSKSLLQRWVTEWKKEHLDILDEGEPG